MAAEIVRVFVMCRWSVMWRAETCEFIFAHGRATVAEGQERQAGQVRRLCSTWRSTAELWLVFVSAFFLLHAVSPIFAKYHRLSHRAADAVKGQDNESERERERETERE